MNGKYLHLVLIIRLQLYPKIFKEILQYLSLSPHFLVKTDVKAMLITEVEFRLFEFIFLHLNYVYKIAVIPNLKNMFITIIYFCN